MYFRFSRKRRFTTWALRWDSLASHFWDLGKQCRPRSDQGLHCLLTRISITNEDGKVHQTALKWRMDSPIWINIINRLFLFFFHCYRMKFLYLSISRGKKNLNYTSCDKNKLSDKPAPFDTYRGKFSISLGIDTKTANEISYPHQRFHDDVLDCTHGLFSRSRI